MFARIVHMSLKPNDTGEFTRVMENEAIPVLRKQKGFRDELCFLARDRKEAVAISLWDQAENAEAYSRRAYTEVLKVMEKVIEGPPRVQAYELANSTVHKIAARAAA